MRDSMMYSVDCTQYVCIGREELWQEGTRDMFATRTGDRLWIQSWTTSIYSLNKASKTTTLLIRPNILWRVKLVLMTRLQVYFFNWRTTIFCGVSNLLNLQVEIAQQDQIKGKAETRDTESLTGPPQIERFRVSIHRCCELPFANANSQRLLQSTTLRNLRQSVHKEKAFKFW